MWVWEYLPEILGVDFSPRTNLAMHPCNNFIALLCCIFSNSDVNNSVAGKSSMWRSVGPEWNACHCLVCMYVCSRIKLACWRIIRPPTIPRVQEVHWNDIKFARSRHLDGRPIKTSSNNVTKMGIPWGKLKICEESWPIRICHFPECRQLTNNRPFHLRIDPSRRNVCDIRRNMIIILLGKRTFSSVIGRSSLRVIDLCESDTNDFRTAACFLPRRYINSFQGLFVPRETRPPTPPTLLITRLKSLRARATSRPTFGNVKRWC